MSPKAKGPIPIPFKANGDLVTYSYLKYPEVRPNTEGSFNDDYFPATWEDNYVFQAELTFHSFRKGRSAVNAIFVSEITGRNFSVFLTDFHDMIPFLKKGRITGDFTFVKRGANYGVMLVSEKK